MLIIPPPKYPRRRGRRQPRSAPPAPAPLEVLVLSVVALPDNSALMTFSVPVTVTATPPGESIWVEDDAERGAWVDEVEQPPLTPDGIIIRADGVVLATNGTWEIVAPPPCLQFPPGSVTPVPQAGVIE